MKLINIATRRRVTIAMFTIGILLFGMVSLSRLQVNLLPEISYPTLTVRADYPGAAPAEIENLISKPIEEALGVVKNAQQVRSISRIGQSDVVMEFTWGTDMNHAILDVREKLDALTLPLEASRPVILRFDPSLDPIMRYTVYLKQDTTATIAPPDSIQADFASQNTSTETSPDDINRQKSLRVFADEQLKKEIESAAGIASVKVSGGFEEEIQILMDQQRMAHLNLSIEQVSGVLSAENVNLSGGRLEEGSQQYLVRTLNQFQTVAQVGDVIIGQTGDRPVYLKDVAEVRESYKEREAITRLNGLEAVEIAIYKEGDANTVAAAQSVKARMVNIEQILPDNMELTQVYDQSKYIESAVSEVINAAVIGGIFAVIILYLFLRNFWTTFIISVSIPVSVIATFNMMYGYDISLNIMSLGGIALGIGLLVDNSIVVLENIARHRAMGKSVVESAREGAGEVGMAVVASTLTTIAVFFPLVFVEGIAGQLFRDQALTVTFALLASLIVAITLIPMMASMGDQSKAIADNEPPRIPKTRFGGWMRNARIFIFTTIPVFVVRWIGRGIKALAAGVLSLLQPIFWLFDKGYGAIEDIYPGIIEFALKRKIMVMATAILLFAGTFLLLPRIGVELIPSLSQGEFRVEFSLPQGTPMERTDNALLQVQTASKEVTGISSIFSVAGTGNRMDANPDQGGENWGELNVMLKDGSGREDEERVMQELRKDLQR
ncbi:MAG: efflux RND transporter permease subunit, partial [Balneolales bacterium]